MTSNFKSLTEKLSQTKALNAGDLKAHLTKLLKTVTITDLTSGSDEQMFSNFKSADPEVKMALIKKALSFVVNGPHGLANRDAYGDGRSFRDRFDHVIRPSAFRLFAERGDEISLENWAESYVLG